MPVEKNIFGMRKEMGVGYYLTDFLFRRILRRNAGARWAVHHTSTIHCPELLIVGKGTYPGDSPGVYINAKNGIRVGDYTNIGPNVGLVSVNHDFINNSQHIEESPIVIGRFCWLGMGAVVLPGVQLGDFTVVGAGAIVARSFTDGYCVLAGNPAKIIKYLDRAECDAFAKSKA